MTGQAAVMRQCVERSSCGPQHGQRTGTNHCKPLQNDAGGSTAVRSDAIERDTHESATRVRLMPVAYHMPRERKTHASDISFSCMVTNMQGPVAIALLFLTRRCAPLRAKADVDLNGFASALRLRATAKVQPFCESPLNADIAFPIERRITVDQPHIVERKPHSTYEARHATLPHTRTEGQDASAHVHSPHGFCMTR